MNADEIFLAAVEKATPAERAAFLDGACALDPQLRAKVEGLLQSHEQAGSFLQQPLFENLATVSQPLTESPGTVIGPYKLLQQIGEGGMGVVYMAEQSEPVERRVALKIIKPGMDTRQIIARFEAERQALAMMDHPNIARVLDAGTTASGRPYFVMELVRGVPITDYCDQHHLTPQERLRLFLAVCHAVQHAHLKGIIHRDLKPTNVLVAEYDDHPVPKVIDFGVAKATSKLTEKTMFTQFGQIVGTLEYMSPEQARFNELDIDTRSDVYSLGVLLYELLTGSTPFDKERLRLAAFDEVIRILREEEPPRPSTRLSTAAARASVAALRKMEPQKLSTLVRGELDWIVMKALEKDRGRRYETANAFAADIHNYLTDQAVLACPPSRGYRFHKFARRNKAAFATMAMVAAALVVGIVGTTWQAIRATREADRAVDAEALADERYTAEKSAREQADAARAEKEVQRQAAEAALEQVELQRQQANENFDKARRAVDEYLAQVTESELLTVPGLQPLREDMLKAALTFYAEFTQERADDPTLQRELASAHYRLGRIHSELGDGDASAAANTEAIRLYEQLRDAGHFEPDMQVALAWCYLIAQRYDETSQLCQDVLLDDAGHAEARSLLADTWNARGSADSENNEIEGALGHHRQAFELREALVRDDPGNPRYLAQLGGSLNNLGVLLARQGKFDEALPMYERAVEYTEQAYERAPHSILWGRWLCACLGNVAGVQARLGREQEALSSYQRLVAVSRKRAFENPAVTSLRGDQYKALLSLGRYQQQLGNLGESARSFREAREVLENIPRETPDQLYELSTVYAALAQPVEGPFEPTEEDAAEQERNVELALETLYMAVDAGFSDARKLRSERQFDVIRERGEFQQLVTALEQAAEGQRLAGRDSESTEQSLADRLRAAELLTNVVVDNPGALRHQETLAATLHSIGVIQTGLKQFDEAEKSFRKALEVWDTLLKFQPGKPGLEVDRLGTQVSLGRLYWDMSRHPEAHLLWKNLRPQLEEYEASGSDGDAVTAGQRLGEIVRPICETYADIGLWEETGACLAATGGDSSAEILRWDATVRLLLNDEAGYHARCAQLVEQSTGTPSTHDLHCIAAACLMAPEGHGDLDRWLQASRECAELRPDWTWAPFYVGLAHYRTGRFDDALDALRSQESWFLAWPLLAMTSQRLGAKADAQTWFDRAHEWYVQRVQTALAGNTTALMDGVYYWDRAQFQLLYREARSVVSASAEPDPWQHLIQARGYRLIGDVERADLELAASVAAAPDDAGVWMARARLLTQWDDQERSVEADWQRAVELAGDDPLPWIHRGRWYAERGEHEKADADFARAASLTPDELNKFLEAGWWVVGPYPAKLDEFCPPEIDPDPSQPVHVVDPGTGLSETPVPWEHLPVGPRGTIDVSRMARVGESAYVMAIVYSSDERTLRMDAFSELAARVWVNGRRAGEFAAANSRDSQHLPVTLAAGRNVILAKLFRTNANGAFRCQLGDSPESRLLQLSKDGLWQEAAQLAVAPACSDLRQSGVEWTFYFPLLHLGPGGPEYESHCRELYQSMSAGRGLSAYRLGMALSLNPNGACESHAGELIEGVNQYLIDTTPDKAGGHYSDALLALGLLLYRTGELDAAFQALDRIDLGGRKGLADAVRALIAHKRGLADEAERWFREAADEARYKRVDPSGYTWRRKALETAILLREAESTIYGTTEQADALLQRWRDAAEQRVQARDPRTAAYDEVVYFTGGLMPEPLLAHGWRLVELGRLDEAETDFNKAAELAPNDPDVLAARGVFLADSGEPVRAAADLHAALSILDEDAARPRWRWGVPIDLEAAQRDEVFDQLAALRPDDPRPLMTRMVLRMQQGDFDGMRLDAERLESYPWPDRSWLGAAALCRGDREAFDRLRATAPRNVDAVANIQLLGLAPTEEPLTTELLQQAEHMWREQPQTRWYRRWLGLAQLRAGQYSEAVASLEASLAPSDRWQVDGVHWPLLAIANHHLGNTDTARRWLDKAALWLELRNAAESRQIGAATGVRDIDPASLLHAMAFYLEARALIDGPDAADAARALLATRGREREEAAQARAEARQQQMLARAEADWQRAVELAGDDPLPWIHRGRWYAERGEQEKADADFAHVASLTPDELNTFLEAGWWVVGPYPANLAEFCPPELDPDPSVPVRVVDPQSGLSEAPERWRPVPTGHLGRVDLTSYPGRTDNASIYALAYVHSPQEQSMLLMIQKTQPLRIWINGQLVEDGTPGEYPPQPHYEQFHRVPVVLRAGRNSVLIKAATADFTVRLGDTPRDRAILLAEQERFAEALAAHAAMTDADRDDLTGATPHTLRPIVALLATDDVYLQACRALFASAPDGWAGHRFSTAHLLALRPNALFDEHAATLAPWADEFLTLRPGDFAFPAVALVHYRAGNGERSLALLDQYPHKPYGLPLRALLSHQADDTAAAESFLQEALSIAAEEAARKERDRSSFHGQWHIPWWYEWAIYLTLLREAEQEIRGETTESDRLRDRCEAVARAKWAASPETVAFDQAILFGCLDDGGPQKYPQPLLARGRRLDELGRFDAAEVDFNQAVELAPDDPDVLLARGLFFADHGQPERAAADFHAALNLFGDPDSPRWKWGSAIDLAVAQRDDVFEQLASLRPPGDTYIWTARVCVLVRKGDLQGAQAAASHLHRISPLHAALALLSGDRGEYERICTSVSDEAHPLPLTTQLGLGPADESLTAKLMSAAERLQQDSPENDYARLWINLAQLRAGDAHQVAGELEDAYSGVSLWRRAISAPILAIAHRQLGDSAASRHWLAQSERLIRSYSAESQPDVTRVLGPDRLMPYDWLYALVLHNEAKQLIDGGTETQEEIP